MTGACSDIQGQYTEADMGSQGEQEMRTGADGGYIGDERGSTEGGGKNVGFSYGKGFSEPVVLVKKIQ